VSDVCTRNSHCEIFIVELQKNTAAAAAANLKSTAHASIDNEMNNYKLQAACVYHSRLWYNLHLTIWTFTMHTLQLCTHSFSFYITLVFVAQRIFVFLLALCRREHQLGRFVVLKLSTMHCIFTCLVTFANEVTY